MASASRISRQLPPPPSRCKLIDDHRFRALLSSEDWGRLPLAIWRRFSMRLADGETIVYVGEVDSACISCAGWCIAQATRLIGGPLPTGGETGVPMIVAVTEDAGTGGQIWTRMTGRRSRFPQVIHSSKRFAGPTGLEEYVGCGVGVALRISVASEALVFRSAGYFLQTGRWKWPLPAWLTPGDLTVIHSDLGGGAFRFTLEIVHPRLGKLLRQSAVFKEATS
jgi:Domain of unknown function (DUF4166)